ncbi:hypothetical protein HII36_40180 [Nonomuraea sp. NN258]|uniref:HD domain-containing protein n=1 Tax=Nonomuraea antri TaxID=2730852 RepID=UPI0015695FC8|nr:ATP-binding protein [Nonomuraea antri]NRQ38006.1 hypothetical protein [Nonomuraea antri]
MFTEHGITHADALWEMASLVCGEEASINPAEAFVLGGAFLLHDLGMGLASYSAAGIDLKKDPKYEDLLAGAKNRLRNLSVSASDDLLERTAHDEVVVELLRLRHAKQAERLVGQVFHTSSGEPFHLLQDVELRQFFGPQIGRIAHSHWWAVSELPRLAQRQGSCPLLPPAWDVDPLKLACMLRLADAAHIDYRRAPMLLHAFRRPTGTSRDHWFFQERLFRPRVVDDRLEYTASTPFSRDEAEAWWLAFETIQLINDELRHVDALLADSGRERFKVRSVVGADSPARLARSIPTDGWKPLDARLRVTDTVQVISNIGGRDMYGNRPDIAIRELVANAADASKARAAFEGSSAVPPVTITLDQHGDEWWLEVADQGIGMRPETMVAALTDFGRSHWRSAATIDEFPGLQAKGFTPTGKFGIGFFAVFMAADEVQVRSLAMGEAARSTHVLEFRRGLSGGRPLIREAEFEECLRKSGTVVRARLRHDPRSAKGIFLIESKRVTHTELLHDLISRMCALSEVDILVKGPADPAPKRVIEADDWVDVPSAELFRRLYGKCGMGYLARLRYEQHEKLFIDHETRVLDDDGNTIGRAMLLSGREALGSGDLWYGGHTGKVYVGGLESSLFSYTMGAFRGFPKTADRLTSFPLGRPENLQEWARSQVDVTCSSPWSTLAHQWIMSDFVGGLGVPPEALPCAYSSECALNKDDLVEWLKDKEEVLLISYAGLMDFDTRVASGRYVRSFFTRDGREVVIPPHGLVVDLYPMWVFPEDMVPSPRDERFAEHAEDDAEWSSRAWWYESGNFGAAGVVVRSVAEAWAADLVDVVTGMEAFDSDDFGDNRLELPCADGPPTRVSGFRVARVRGAAGKA